MTGHLAIRGPSSVLAPLLAEGATNVWSAPACPYRADGPVSPRRRTCHGRTARRQRRSVYTSDRRRLIRTCRGGRSRAPFLLTGHSSPPLRRDTRSPRLTPADLATWSTTAGKWATPGGTYAISVGDASNHLPLSGTFTIKGPDPAGETVAGVAANLCLDDHWASTDGGSPIQIYPCNGTAAQKVTAASDGTLRIQGKCVDVKWGGHLNHTPVWLYTCTKNNGAQQWVLQPNSRLFNPQSGRCLDDPGSTLTAGTQLQIYDCNKTAAQRWRIP
jgi:hypothetical protein